MTGATIVPPDVDEYLAAVRRALADLPPAERDDLVAEVEASLAEAAADTDTPLASSLGAPHEFAAELRAAAGLQEVEAAERAPLELRRLARELVARPGVQAAASLARELAPLWWAARGVVAVLALAHVFDAGWATRYQVIPSGNVRFGLALLFFGVLASLAVGLWTRRQRGLGVRRTVAALNVALAIAAVPVALAVDPIDYVWYGATPTPELPVGLVYDGQPVRNVYPFSRDGRLLHDVLLYDDLGRPLEIAGNRGLDPERRVVVTNGNRPLWNAFPIRYYEPGTRRVARPNARPYIELPLVLTPPLPSRASQR